MELPDDKRSIVLEWQELLKESLQRKSFKAVKTIMTLSNYFLTPNNDHVDNLNTFNKHSFARRRKTNFVADEKSDSSLESSYYTALAVQTQDVRFMKLFHSYHYRIEFPHEADCPCLLCEVDPLGQSKKRIVILQALSNPMWIGLTSSDPFLMSFKISKRCRLFSSFHDCYEKVYQSIVKTNKDFCCSLLDHIENEAEVQCLMNWKHKKFNPFSRVRGLDFIRLGIKYGQKEVVSHSVSQHVITTIVDKGLSGWKTGRIPYRLMVIIFIGLLYPVTSMAQVIMPSSSLGQLSSKPLVKFISGAASYITWLCLLGYIAAYPKNGIRAGGFPSYAEIINFVWLISFLVQEVGELRSTGKKNYFGSGWNWIDIGMIQLMLSAYVMWFVIYFIQPSPPDDFGQALRFIVSMADSCYGIAIILSFFRMVYLCQITRYLGLLQLCVGGMLQVIFQFAFIGLVVLISFSGGMIFLFHSSTKYEETVRQIEHHIEADNLTYMHQIFSGSYNGLPATTVTLAWACMSLVSLESLKGFDDGTMIHVLSYGLYTLYHGISTIVLLNMLIAMMSNSYQKIENNIEVEHKYARTHLWLQYIGDTNTLPCPFNLLPTYNNCKQAVHFVKRLLCVKTFKEKQREKTLRVRSQREQYEVLCKKLVERHIQAKYNLSLVDTVAHEPLLLIKVADDTDQMNKIVDPFNDRVEEKVKQWTTSLSRQSTAGVKNNNQKYGRLHEQPYTGEFQEDVGEEVEETNEEQETAKDNVLVNTNQI